MGNKTFCILKKINVKENIKDPRKIKIQFHFKMLFLFFLTHVRSLS